MRAVSRRGTERKRRASLRALPALRELSHRVLDERAWVSRSVSRMPGDKGAEQNSSAPGLPNSHSVTRADLNRGTYKVIGVDVSATEG